MYGAEALIIKMMPEDLSEEVLQQLPERRAFGNTDQKICDIMVSKCQKISEELSKEKHFQTLTDFLVIAKQKSQPILFWKLQSKLFGDDPCLTWETIFQLFALVGITAETLVKAGLHKAVFEIVECTLSFFKSSLLFWVQHKGGWFSSVMSDHPTMSPHTTSPFVAFTCGLGVFPAVAFVIAWYRAKLA